MKLPTQLPVTLIKPDKVIVSSDGVDIYKNNKCIMTFYILDEDGSAELVIDEELKI